MRGIGVRVLGIFGAAAVTAVIALTVLMGAAPAALAAEVGATREVAAASGSAADVAAGEEASGLVGGENPAADVPRADADREIYAIFYDNPDGKSYTLVIQNGDELDPAYPKPSDNRVILVCGEGKCNCGSWSSGEFSPYTTCVRAKPDVAPHSLAGWFSGSSALKTADLSGLKTFQVTGTRRMFAGCSSLDTLDLSGFDTARVTDMTGMFDGCSSLEFLDISSFDTSSVTNMGDMFARCSSVKALEFGEKFKTDSVTYMGYMFSGCSSLKTLNLSAFNTSNVRGMNGMFYDCSSLANISFSPAFTTSRVTGMGDMFAGCASLKTLDLSSFDMTFVVETGEMLPSGVRKIVLPATGDFSKIGLPGWTQTDDFRTLEIKWRNEKGEVFAADAIPARTAGTYTAVIEDDGSGSNGSGGDNGNSDGNGGNSSSGDGSGNGNGGSNNGSGNGSGNGNGSGSGNGGSNGGAASPAPKRTVALSEAVALPLNATGVAMDKDDIVRDLAKRFGSREDFPVDASSVAVTIMLGGEEVDAIDPRRAGSYEVTAVYSMPDGTERVIEATYTVADPAAKAPVKSTAKSATRLAQTGDEVPAAAPLATAALAACALAAAVAGRRRVRG